MDRLLLNTPLGTEIAAFKLWDIRGQVHYSTQEELEGRVFPVEGGLLAAWEGELAAEIDELEDAENVFERETALRLLEIYSPVRLRNDGPVIAVAEFYHDIQVLEEEIQAAQRSTWFIVALVTVAMYLLLARIVKQASDTIVEQRETLRDNIAQLTTLLEQNERLNERVRRAAARTTALNERYLRRISAELHDGPAQALALALLRFDAVMNERNNSGKGGDPERTRTARAGEGPDAGSSDNRIENLEEIEEMEAMLTHALREIRTIATGLRLPELQRLSLAETVTRVVRVHERNTGTSVALDFEAIPEQASLPVKITLYRVIQEALNNAYRHAEGKGQRVEMRADNGLICVDIADAGPGFTATILDDGQGHLGLIGMRERVESLGGHFNVESIPNDGTVIKIRLLAQAEEEVMDE
jgi:signal transduction histidine kinase